MAITVNKIEEAFTLMFKGFLQPSFVKTLKLKKRTERQLLPLIRVGLLCYFGEKVIPEVEVNTPWTKSKKSRIDFRVANTAIEFAVRNPGRSKTNVSAYSNVSEVKKLLKWKEGRSVLVLFDFSREPLPANEFAAFRKHPSLGKGNHSKNAFTLLYFHIESLKPLNISCHRKEIRRATRKS